MTNPYATFSERPVYGFLGPVIWPRSYTRLFYLLIGFPLGLAYFVVYVTGTALGLGLAILGVGLVLLALMVLLARPLGTFERYLAIHLVGEDVPPFRAAPLADDKLTTWLEDAFTSGATWKSLLFLVLKFPLGLASWIAVVTVFSLMLGLVFSPVVVAAGGNVQMGIWEPTTPAEALWLVPAGLLGYVLAIHLFNGLAWSWGKLARVLLGSRPRPATPAPAALRPLVAQPVTV